MRLKIVSLVLLSILPLSLRWPVENGRVTSTFGESRADHFHDGVDMVCPDDKIYPIEDGELLYMWEKSMFPLENYPGGGNQKILMHQNGYCSVYMHLVDGGLHPPIYKKGEMLSKIGNTGHSYGKHLHFSIFDFKSGVSVNPITMMPEYVDKTEPKIDSLLLRIDEKYITLKDKSTIRLTRNYPLLIKIFDTVTGRENLGIFSLTVHHNGKKATEVKFDRLETSPNGLTFAKRTFDSLFDEAGYYKVPDVKYVQGLNEIRVAACDYSGNCAERTFSLEVNIEFGLNN